MNNNVELILEKILTIIDYKDDKHAFINEFMMLCLRSALADYMKLLSEERKKELQQLLQEKDSVKLKEQLEPYTVTEEFIRLLLENSERLFQSYLDTIMPLVSEEQKNNLENYFTSIGSDQSSAAVQNV